MGTHQFSSLCSPALRVTGILWSCRAHYACRPPGTVSIKNLSGPSVTFIHEDLSTIRKASFREILLPRCVLPGMTWGLLLTHEAKRAPPKTPRTKKPRRQVTLIAIGKHIYGRLACLKGIFASVSRKRLLQTLTPETSTQIQQCGENRSFFFSRLFS